MIEETGPVARSFNVSADTEWSWIRQVRAGQREAFEPLVLRYQGEALATAEALLLDADDAADAVQDAFVRAYRKLGGLTEGSPFGPWFRSILRHVCIDRLRAPSRRRREPVAEEVLDGQIWVEPTGTSVLEREELADAVWQALRTVSPAHREVLVLKEIDGLSYSEIAAALGLSAGTVASRLFHARDALRRAVLAQRITQGDTT